MKKINISYLGHGEPNFHSDQHKYLKDVLEKANFQVIITNEIFNDSINILFEGFWPNLMSKVRHTLSLDKNKDAKIILLTTEYWVGENTHDISNFTYNNWIYEARLKNKTFKKIYLSIINKLFNFLLLFEGSKYLNFLSFYLNNANHNSKSIINRTFLLPLHWKKLCFNSYSLMEYYDAILCFGPNNNLFEISKNYSIPFFYLRWFNFDNDKNYSIRDKNYDFHFTGRINEYRLQIINQIKSFGYKVYYSDIQHDEKKREEKILESKYSISLKQDLNQNLISVSRINYSFKYKIPCLMQISKNQSPKYFNRYLMFYNISNLKKCLDFYINNYKNINTKFIKNLKNLEHDAKIQISNLSNFINNI